MPKRRALIALATMALIGGCANRAPVQEVDARPVKRAAVQTRRVDCTTTDVVLITLSHCGSNGIDLFSPAAE